MMNNLRLVGGRLDQINLRVSLLVILVFTIITIISYFYELSRAGLLSKQTYHSPHLVHIRHRETRDTIPPQGGAARQQEGPGGDLGLQINNIKESVRLQGNTPQEINIAVHLGKNDSYAKVENTSFHAYQHQNTHPNFFTKCVNGSECIQQQRAAYYNATQVLVYQHDPGGYFMRQCFKHTAEAAGKTFPSLPLNSATREEWEHTSKKKKSAYAALYGGLSFGVCETVSHPCLYVTLLPHPIDRILTIYDICQHNQTSTFCKVNGFLSPNISLDEFVRGQGNNLFHRLLYNHRHCKLVGQDEICLPDSKASFVLSHDEKQAYLDDILNNLEQWFAVLGLESHLQESLLLFESALRMPFTECLALRQLHSPHFDTYVLTNQLDMSLDGIPHYYDQPDSKPGHLKLRDDLLQDPQVHRWLYADLEIYQKLEDIFKKQIKAYKLMEKQKQVYRKKKHKSEWDSENRHSLRKITVYNTYTEDSTENLSSLIVMTSTKGNMKSSSTYQSAILTLLDKVYNYEENDSNYNNQSYMNLR